MQENNRKHFFDKLKKEGEKASLSNTHLASFEDKLKVVSPKKGKSVLFFAYRIAAVFILGFVLLPFLNKSDINGHPEYVKYQETKSYFTTYVEYEIGKHKEEMNPENEALILANFQEVIKLQKAYAQLEQDFINQDYDKRILKRMIDNFRLQLDILENIDEFLKSSKQNNKTDENII